MKTIKLYENNAYLRTCDAVVTLVCDEHPSDAKCEQMYTVCFDQTVFFPEGGGQSSDTGTAVMTDAPEHEFMVTDAQIKDGIVYHVLIGNGKAPEPGDKMTLTIDWAHRFDNMQRHLGEHILSGAFYRLFGFVNKGFHMGDDYIMIDLAPDSEAQERKGLFHYDHVTWEMAEAAELDANRVIWKDAPVTRSHFDTREEAEILPLRKTLAFDEDISVITVGDLPDPDDCVNCCGTHPSSAGQVGLIKIYKIEPNRGMSRIYLECGERAFRHYQTRHDDLYDISCALSAGFDDIQKKFIAFQGKTNELHDRIYALTQKIVKSEVSSILASDENVEIRRYDDLTVSDLLLIVKQLDKTGSGKDLPELIILISTSENTAILTSKTRDCGKIVKENAPAFSGKGGGKAQMARVMFDSSDDLDGFIDKITS